MLTSVDAAEEVGLLQPGHGGVVRGEPGERRQVEIGRRLADQHRGNELGVDAGLEPDEEESRERGKNDQRQEDEERPAPGRRLVVRRAHLPFPAERRRTPRDSSSLRRRRWARPSRAVHRTRPRSTAAVTR